MRYIQQFDVLCDAVVILWGTVFILYHLALVSTITRLGCRCTYHIVSYIVLVPVQYLYLFQPTPCSHPCSDFVPGCSIPTPTGHMSRLSLMILLTIILGNTNFHGYPICSNIDIPTEYIVPLCTLIVQSHTYPHTSLK